MLCGNKYFYIFFWSAKISFKQPRWLLKIYLFCERLGTFTKLHVVGIIGHNVQTSRSHLPCLKPWTEMAFKSSASANGDIASPSRYGGRVDMGPSVDGE